MEKPKSNDQSRKTSMHTGCGLEIPFERSWGRESSSRSGPYKLKKMTAEHPTPESEGPHRVTQGLENQFVKAPTGKKGII